MCVCSAAQAAGLLESAADDAGGASESPQTRGLASVDEEDAEAVAAESQSQHGGDAVSHTGRSKTGSASSKHFAGSQRESGSLPLLPADYACLCWQSLLRR